MGYGKGRGEWEISILRLTCALGRVPRLLWYLLLELYKDFIGKLSIIHSLKTWRGTMFSV